MDNNNLGEVIKERRKSKKLKLRQVTAMSGVSTSHLGRIEKGKRFPSIHTLRKLAEPLGFTETELLRQAGFLPRDSEDRLDRLKQEIKREIADTLVALHNKIDSF